MAHGLGSVAISSGRGLGAGSAAALAPLDCGSEAAALTSAQPCEVSACLRAVLWASDAGALHPTDAEARPGSGLDTTHSPKCAQRPLYALHAPAYPWMPDFGKDLASKGPSECLSRCNSLNS
jgi:hypothetical protein